MEAIDLNDLINFYNQKLDTTVRVNNEVLFQMKLQKPKKTMQKVLYSRIIEVVTFSVLAIFFGWYIFNRMGNTNLFICGIIVGVFNTIALSGSITQLLLIDQVDYSKPIIEIKEKIEKINSHELYIVKLLLLSAPLWWAFSSIVLDFIFGIDLIANIDSDIKIIYITLNVLLLIPLIYLLMKLNAKNAHKKVVRKAIKLFSSSKVLRALEELKNIEKFKKEMNIFNKN